MGLALEPWDRELDLLQTIPGIARSSAHAILAELGPEPTRVFPDAASLAAWAGVCPGNDESAGERRSGRLRAGNAALRDTLPGCPSTHRRRAQGHRSGLPWDGTNRTPDLHTLGLHSQQNLVPVDMHRD